MIVSIHGGLGNQMFQAAFARCINEKYNIGVDLIDINSGYRCDRKWELECFNIPSKKISIYKNILINNLIYLQRLLSKVSNCDAPFVFSERSYLKIRKESFFAVSYGYWQGEVFFDSTRFEICNYFRFPVDFTSEVKQDTSVPVVAIHVRRGDYVTDPTSSSIHLVCGIEYYRRAWLLMREKLGPCKALVFSDDSQWCEENLGLSGNVEYVKTDNTSPAWVDMAKMSCCEHFIISNSSYSWWAAYLSKSLNKEVIAPLNWFANIPTKSLDIYIDSWILV